MLSDDNFGIMFLRFPDPYSLQDSANYIYQAGFRSVMLWWYDNFLQAGFTNSKLSRYDQLDIIKKNKLNISCIHSNSAINSNELWNNSELSEKIIDDMKKTIIECNEIEVPIMIMHITSGDIIPEPNELGLHRLSMLAEFAIQKGVTIAIENTRSSKHVDYVLEKNNKLEFCYDSGHDFIYSKRPYELLKKWHKRIGVMHLHDNEGLHQNKKKHLYVDNHLIPGEGSIDWKYIKKQLVEINYSGICIFEIESNTMDKNDNPKAFLDRAYRAINLFI
jgi:sugar phosphate isomerase/epimerase